MLYAKRYYGGCSSAWIETSGFCQSRIKPSGLMQLVVLFC